MPEWKDKLDARLRAWLDTAPGPDALAECLIRVDDAALGDVDALVVGFGGAVRHRIGVLPGLVVSLPRRSIEPLATNAHVVSIEADRTYRIA